MAIRKTCKVELSCREGHESGVPEKMKRREEAERVCGICAKSDSRQASSHESLRKIRGLQ